MSEHEIPEAAVEAAAVAYASELEMTGQLPWEDLPAERKESRFRWMRAALEAAARHMLAEAWEAGRDAEFQRSVMKRQTDPNPYRSEL